MGVRATASCPKCDSTRCRPSRWSSHEEKSSNPGKHPYRCQSCSHRFIADAHAPSSGFGFRNTGLTATAAIVVIGAVTASVAVLWPDGTAIENATPVARDTQGSGANSTLEAARGGDLEAQFRVGRAALLDTSRGKEGTVEGVTWLRRAADGGHSGAMLQLGKLYRSGVGVPQNYEYAEKWVRSAADAGNSEAMVELGRLYRSGLGVKADLVKAYVWFNRAAAAMDMEGVHERDLLALKLNAQELKTAQAESLAAEESPAEAVPAPLAQD